MEKPLPPIMDLALLATEVLDKGPTSALPCNLPDSWLDQVAESLEQVFENEGKGGGEYMAGPLSLVVNLLFSKITGPKLEVSQSRLEECLRSYRVEVALESANRRTNVRSTSATLETIFTNRVVDIRVAD